MICITNSYNSYCRGFNCIEKSEPVIGLGYNSISSCGCYLYKDMKRNFDRAARRKIRRDRKATEPLHCTTRDGAGGKIYLKPKLPPKNFAASCKDRSMSLSIGTLEILEMGCRDWIGNSKRPH